LYSGHPTIKDPLAFERRAAAAAGATTKIIRSRGSIVYWRHRSCCKLLAVNFGFALFFGRRFSYDRKKNNDY
jgi:hypothetical protein